MSACILVNSSKFNFWKGKDTVYAVCVFHG